MSLAMQKCEPCYEEVPQVNEKECQQFMAEIPEWTVKTRENITILERVFKLKNYKQALAFTNKIAELAEVEKHHPEILLEWGKVTVTWWTHTANGLHKNDFICAAKTDVLYGERA